VPRVNDIVLERRGITPEMALRFATYFGTTAEFWINLQADYECRMAKAEFDEALKEIKPLAAAD
jgi:addiction module HigA family antidote